MTQTEADLKGWQQQQSRFQKIFGNDAILDKSFQKIKLKELEKIYRNNKRTGDPVEKATLQWLKAGNKSIERMLYPRFRQRLIRHLIRGIRSRNVANTKQQRNVSPEAAVSKGWMERHVNGATGLKQPNQHTGRVMREVHKEPRVRMSEAEGNALRMSR